MKTQRAVRSFPWQRGWLLSAALLALSAPLFAASPKSRISRSAAGAGPKPVPAASVSKQGSQPAAPEFADAYASAHVASADQALPKESANKAEALANFGRALVADDAADSEAALAGYRKALELDPSYAELAVKVAFELAKRNDPSAGIQILKDAVKASPKEPLPLIYLSQLYSKFLKKPDLALKYAEQAIALDSTQIAAHLCVLEIHLSNGQLPKVEQDLDRASNSASKDPEFWVQLGEVYSRIYFRDGSEKVPAETLKKMNTIFKKAAELGKDDALIQAKVGNFFIDSKQTKEAVPYYLTAISLKQNSDDPVLANAREKLARALLEEGDRDQAIQLLEQITKDNPLRFATFELLGELYEQKGDLDKALANYQHSMLLDASEPNNHLRIAELQARLKKFDDAIETARVARAKFPDDPKTLYLLAIVLSQAKKHTEAMTAFAAAQAEFEANHEELLNSSFYFAYGMAAEQAGLTEKAAELLKKSIELDPSSAAQTYNYLGYMWIDRGENLDEAGKMIQKALEMEPENGAFVDSLGWYYYKAGEFDKALKELLRAVKLITPEDAVVFEHLGDVYQAMGNTAEAVRSWEKSLTIENNSKITDKIAAAKQKAPAAATPVVAKPEGPK